MHRCFRCLQPKESRPVQNVLCGAAFVCQIGAGMLYLFYVFYSTKRYKHAESWRKGRVAVNLLMQMKRVQDLSPSERQIVNYILNDPESVSSMGIVELARRTYTSTSTVMRVSKKLGMDSFIDFRLQLAADLKDYLDSAMLFKNGAPIAQHDSIQDIVDKVTSSNVRAVVDVKRLNDPAAFERVVAMMCGAKQLDFYGSGMSNLICHDAMIKALRLGVPSTAYAYYSEMAMLAKTSDATHLGVVISYTGQTEDTLRVARILKENKVPSVSITSYSGNALLELCTENLYVDSEETVFRVGGMSSRLSGLHVLDILFTAYMNEDREHLQKIVDKTFLKETFRQETSP